MVGLAEPFSEPSMEQHMGGTLEPPFRPCFLFFYGSLMDPDVLQVVVGLPETPTVFGGWVTGFSVKMWGRYPTLIPCERGKVVGRVWKVNELSQFSRLQEYETSTYSWCACDIELVSGETMHSCRTFYWAGDPDSKNLKMGFLTLKGIKDILSLLSSVNHKFSHAGCLHQVGRVSEGNWIQAFFTRGNAPIINRINLAQLPRVIFLLKVYQCEKFHTCFVRSSNTELSAKKTKRLLSTIVSKKIVL
jgi:gamma-glutamylcyclotransferase (GGCT)/AIG2-like uncharacterized protein YtfP